MILNVLRQVHDRVAAAVTAQYGLADVPPFAIEVPPNRAMGDLAVTVAFQLAKPLRKAPRAIAQELIAAIGLVPGVSKIEAAPNGYLNISLDRRAFLLARLRGEAPAADAGTREKTVVEHTAINPNKAAHIGHLRNATLGDTLVRVLRFNGTPVEVQNYIDDLGVQVADIIVGFRDLEHKSLGDIRTIADTTRFDYYCWDLYARVTEWYDGQADRLGARDADAARPRSRPQRDGRHRRLHRRPHRPLPPEDDGEAERRLRPADARRRHPPAAVLGARVRHPESAGRRVPADRRQAGGMLGDAHRRRPGSGEEGEASHEPEDLAKREKVIVRSNGVVTYVGKDIANQFWKFGLLGRDFRYRLFGTQADGRPLWATTSGDTDPAAPAFGRARRIYNVIDSRQMYLQALLSQALRTLGHPDEAERSVHFSYEMVALSHATAKELGYEPAADGKPFVEVSGRKGLGVKIDDLLDLLTAKAAAEVAKRNPEIHPDDRARTAGQIAVAAIRYFMLKFSRGKLIVFDIEEALSFEGETGPYLQYAVVRANNIFHKLQEREGHTAADIVALIDQTPADELESLDCWAMVLEASRLDDVVDQVVRSLEFSGLAKYAFGLAQMFNGFYHRYPILGEERPELKRWRAAAVSYVRDELTRALALMGIEVPARM